MPVARPEEPAPEPLDVRSRIVDAAMRLFAARGFEATSLSAIAGAVGITKPSLLYHFPAKDDLLAAVLDAVLSHWNDTLPRLLSAATSGGDQFERVTAELVAFFTADPDRARLLLREMLDRPNETKVRLRRYLRPWVSLVADYVQRGQQQGRVHPDVDPEAYVLHVIHLVVGGIAVADTMGVILGEGDEGRGRLVTEMLRIARASLFIERSP